MENLTTAYYLEDTLLILNRELKNEPTRNMPRAPKQPLKPTEPMEMVTTMQSTTNTISSNQTSRHR